MNCAVNRESGIVLCAPHHMCAEAALAGGPALPTTEPGTEQQAHNECGRPEPELPAGCAKCARRQLLAQQDLLAQQASPAVTVRQLAVDAQPQVRALEGGGRNRKRNCRRNPSRDRNSKTRAHLFHQSFQSGFFLCLKSGPLGNFRGTWFLRARPATSAHSRVPQACCVSTQPRAAACHVSTQRARMPQACCVSTQPRAAGLPRQRPL